MNSLPATFILCIKCPLHKINKNEISLPAETKNAALVDTLAQTNFTLVQS